MYDHVGLKVRDLEASVRFYTAVLGALGYELRAHDASYAGLCPKDRFYAAGLSQGASDHGRPGVRAESVRERGVEHTVRGVAGGARRRII